MRRVLAGSDGGNQLNSDSLAPAMASGQAGGLRERRRGDAYRRGSGSRGVNEPLGALNRWASVNNGSSEASTVR